MNYSCAFPSLTSSSAVEKKGTFSKIVALRRGARQMNRRMCLWGVRKRQFDKPPPAHHHGGVPAPFSSLSDTITHHSAESIHQSRRTAPADAFTGVHICPLLVKPWITSRDPFKHVLELSCVILRKTRQMHGRYCECHSSTPNSVFKEKDYDLMSSVLNMSPSCWSIKTSSVVPITGSGKNVQTPVKNIRQPASNCMSLPLNIHRMDAVFKSKIW